LRNGRTAIGAERRSAHDPGAPEVVHVEDCLPGDLRRREDGEAA
jgi:hypothetical protein